MKYYSRFFTFFCVLIFCTHFSSAQQSGNLQTFYSDHLKVNGVFVSSDVTAIPYADIDRMATCNFDAYRGYNTREHVKIKNGPTIELASIQERIAAGSTIDQSIIDKKQSIAAATYAHPIVTIVDAGLGQPTATKSKEVTTYTIQPTH